MHADRANRHHCHVTQDCHLVNRPTRQWSWGRLTQYRGTISTHSLNHESDVVQYWETLSVVRMGRGVLEPGDSILEMGIAEEGSVDSNYHIRCQPRYWCVSVSCCNLHRPVICTSIWQEGRQDVCQAIRMHHSPWTEITLHYGIAVDIWRGRIVFIDVATGVVLAKLDTQFRESLFPMFGISARQHYCAVTMTLISGNDIHLTDRKRWLIYDAMSH